MPAVSGSFWAKIARADPFFPVTAFDGVLHQDLIFENDLI